MTKISSPLLRLATLALSSFPITAQPVDTSEPMATVKFHVIDQYGRTVECQVSTFSNDKRDMASHFVGLRATKIPYGSYRYVIHRPGPGVTGEDLYGRVPVGWPEQLFVITVRRTLLPGLTIDRALPAGFVLRGRLNPVPVPNKSPGLLWVRLSPTHGERQLDVPVDSSGEFRIYDALDGQYVLSVIRGEEVLHIQQVSFEEDWQSATFVVPLSKDAPSVLHVRPGKGTER